jgi:hypothetical protein
VVADGSGAAGEGGVGGPGDAPLRPHAGLHPRRGSVLRGRADREHPRPRREPRRHDAPRPRRLRRALSLHLPRPSVQLGTALRRVRRRALPRGLARDDARAPRSGERSARGGRRGLRRDRRHRARTSPGRDGRRVRARAARLDHHRRAERRHRAQGDQPRARQRDRLRPRVRPRARALADAIPSSATGAPTTGPTPRGSRTRGTRARRGASLRWRRTRVGPSAPVWRARRSIASQWSTPSTSCASPSRGTTP